MIARWESHNWRCRQRFLPRRYAAPLRRKNYVFRSPPFLGQRNRRLERRYADCSSPWMYVRSR